MSEKSFFHRVVIPPCVVMIPLVASFLVYFNSSRIENETLHQFVAMASGLILIVSVLLGALVIYPLAFFRGARPAERIIVSLIPAVVFEVYEIYVAGGVFTFAESLYYGLSPLSITIFLLAFGFMGLCELVCRWITRQRGGQGRILTPAPIAGIVAMIIGVCVTMIWGNGAHFFYLYINGYLALFKS